MSTVYTERDRSSLAADVAYVFRVAYRLTGHAHDAEDLVQDVCERALRNAPDLAGEDDRRRWLLRVLYNRFVDSRRRRGRSPLVASDDAGVAADDVRSESPEPEELAAQSDAEAALERAWARLEPAQRMLLLLRAEGHDLDEIALITETDKPALSSRLHRARASLARHLEEDETARPSRATVENAR